MSRRNENIAVGGHQHIGRLVEGIRPASRNPSLAKRQKHFSIRAEFHNLMPLTTLPHIVSHPNVSVSIDKEPVRLHEQARAEVAEQFSGGIELEDRIEVRIGAT